MLCSRNNEDCWKEIKGIETEQEYFGIMQLVLHPPCGLQATVPVSCRRRDIKRENEKSGKTDLAVRSHLATPRQDAERRTTERGRRCVERNQNKQQKNETHESQSSIPTSQKQTMRHTVQTHFVASEPCLAFMRYPSFPSSVRP